MTRIVAVPFCTLLLAIVLPTCSAASRLDANLSYLFQKATIKLDAVRDVAQVPDNLSAILRDKNGAIA